jgi:predicted nucleic acid-binding protein
MAVKVIDASALAAILFAEPDADTVAAAAGDALLAAPALVEYELGNTCWKKCRRYPQQAIALRAAFLMLGEMNLSIHDVDAAAVLSLAESTHITFYDASYLWLAAHLGTPLISLDRRLISLAKSHARP